MKLQILIPHYHETPEVIQPLLDSLAIQQNIDFHELGVIICHDGEEPGYGAIPNENQSKNIDLEKDYPFEIKQIHIPHSGVSAARNAALDAATADYVMFCDADDMFYNACGLWMIFREIEIGFDSLVSVFIEESRIPENIPGNPQIGQPAMKKGDITYINHEMDSTFVHGKVHKRRYLLDQNIRWNEKLTIHEDSFFNILCQNLSQNVKYCQSPFYLWKWRDDSVCRHDPKYILKTYRNMIDSNDALVDEFTKRKVNDKAMFYTGFMIFDAYYTMNKPEWINQENKEYRDSTEQRFSEYFLKRKNIWDNINSADKMFISNQVRTRSVMEGMQMEAITIDDWLKHISELGGQNK